MREARGIALGAIVDRLAAEGYTFVTVSQLGQPASSLIVFERGVRSAA